MSLKPLKKSDMRKKWMKPRRDRNRAAVFCINQRYHKQAVQR